MKRRSFMAAIFGGAACVVPLMPCMETDAAWVARIFDVSYNSIRPLMNHAAAMTCDTTRKRAAVETFLVKEAQEWERWVLDGDGSSQQPVGIF